MLYNFKFKFILTVFGTNYHRATRVHRFYIHVAGVVKIVPEDGRSLLGCYGNIDHRENRGPTRVYISQLEGISS